MSQGNKIYEVNEIYIGNLPINTPDVNIDTRYNNDVTTEQLTQIFIIGLFASSIYFFPINENIIGTE